MIWALHGFLGRGRDWAAFETALRAATGLDLRSPDLLDRPIPEETPEQWARRFVRAVQPLDSEPILMGYSMGGRLALHALLDAPTFFRAAIIVSAGLGIEGDRERQMRRVRDDRWAARFELEPWDQVLADWNAQPLFGGSEPPESRLENDFDRQALAIALRWWSPAVQRPLGLRLGELKMPILWIAGERDERYAAEARKAGSLLPAAEVWIAPGASHRVPWEVPEAFTARVADFLRR